MPATPPDAFVDPISMTIMLDPVSAADGHSYERKTIQRWLEVHSSSPNTNEGLRHKQLTPNHSLRGLIDDWCCAHPDAPETRERAEERAKVQELRARADAVARSRREAELEREAAAVARDRQYADLPLRVGETVQIHNTSRADLNGCTGIVESLPPGGQRAVVNVTPSNDLFPFNPPRSVSLKLTNLEKFANIPVRRRQARAPAGGPEVGPRRNAAEQAAGASSAARELEWFDDEARRAGSGLLLAGAIGAGLGVVAALATSKFGRQADDRRGFD